MAYKILTFDGGGICGLFTAAVLDRLVAAHPRLLDEVDLLAGTSTGGIIALALAAGKKPKDLVRLYRDEGKRIFDDSWLDDLLDLGKIAGADYDNCELKEYILSRELGGTTLGLQKRVLIPAFDLDAPAATDRVPPRPRMWKPKFFHNFPGPGTDEKEKAVDVAMRTSAAPTFFLVRRLHRRRRGREQPRHGRPRAGARPGDGRAEDRGRGPPLTGTGTDPIHMRATSTTGATPSGRSRSPSS